jgi:putative addiction module killer protein
MLLKRDEKFDEFFSGIKDEVTKGKITARITRLMLGNPGDAEGVGEGVVELRIDYGPGWRVYYIKVGDQIIVLLGGGSKRHQQHDIDAAKERAKQYKRSI